MQFPGNGSATLLKDRGEQGGEEKVDQDDGQREEDVVVSRGEHLQTELRPNELGKSNHLRWKTLLNELNVLSSTVGVIFGNVNRTVLEIKPIFLLKIYHFGQRF